jgi:hypothetical protein
MIIQANSAVVGNTLIGLVNLEIIDGKIHAVNLGAASNPDQIIEYKNSIREKYLNSPATNMEEFSKNFFNTLKKLWNEKVNA